MIKIYGKNAKWIGEITTLNIMVVGSTEEEAIYKLCHVLEHFLIESYRKGKLRAILDDQR